MSILALPWPFARKKPAVPHAKKPDGLRETIEAIAFAFILAFLFRTFIAEAFVIPTGSMAPTLFGRNKDVVCTGCGYKFTVGASYEVDPLMGRLHDRIDTANCPNCRHLNDVRDLPVFRGDRILVNKFPYEVGDPQRWDVIVFKYPETPTMNYIKRLVGLPGEEIHIERGDVYARPKGTGEYKILRKDDPYKQKALQIPVFDDAHPPIALIKAGWPENWAGMKPVSADGPNSWTADPTAFVSDPAARRYAAKAGEDWKWLRYRHFVPKPEDWDAVADGRPLTTPPLPELITDYCGYNHFHGPQKNEDVFWVGDLSLDARVEIKSAPAAGAALLLELNRGNRRYRCSIDATTGQATLTRDDELKGSGEPLVMANGSTPLQGTGSWKVYFANVDQRLCLWVNDRLVEFDQPTTYAPGLPDPQEADLTPVGIAVRGFDAVVSDLVVLRDIYYISDQRPEPFRRDKFEGDGRSSKEEAHSKSGLLEKLSNPQGWAALYNQTYSVAEFEALNDDEFFVMGDNSPESSDARVWPNTRLAEHRHAVPRSSLIGKAFFIYWPHGVPFLNDGKGFAPSRWLFYHRLGNPAVENYPEFTIPFYPQYDRWKRIR